MFQNPMKLKRDTWSANAKEHAQSKHLRQSSKKEVEPIPELGTHSQTLENATNQTNPITPKITKGQENERYIHQNP